MDIISYTILASAIAKAASDPKKASAGILEKIQLDTELYRLGHNKACLYIHTHIMPAIFEKHSAFWKL